MIRIVLPLILIALAGFGPWTDSGATGITIADKTIGCVAELKLPTTAACMPEGALAQKLIAWTMVLGGAAAVLSILGLLPLVGRVTSIVVIAAGALGLGAAGYGIMGAMEAGGVASTPWGVWATLVAALATAFVGFNGLRGEVD
jgi:hypothetical protein